MWMSVISTWKNCRSIPETLAETGEVKLEAGCQEGILNNMESSAELNRRNRWNNGPKRQAFKSKIEGPKQGERFDLWGTWALKANGRTFNVEARLVIYNVSLSWSHWLIERCDQKRQVWCEFTHGYPWHPWHLLGWGVYRFDPKAVHLCDFYHTCVHIYYATGTLEKKNNDKCNVVNYYSLLGAPVQTLLIYAFYVHMELFRICRNDLKRSMWLVEAI